MTPPRPQHAHSLSTLATLVAVASTFGCFDPSLPLVECSPTGRCPDGQSCQADGLCHSAPESVVDKDATLLVTGSGLFDVVRLDSGFLIAVDTGGVDFFHIDSNDQATPLGTIPASGSLSFLSLEIETSDQAFMVFRDDDALRRSLVTSDALDVSVDFIGDPITGAMSHIDTTSTVGPSLAPVLGVSYYQSGQLSFLNSDGSESTQPTAAEPGYTSLGATSVGELLLYEEGGQTHYWRPVQGNTGVLGTAFSTATLLCNGGLDIVAGVHASDGHGFVHLLSTGQTLDAGTRFDLGTQVIDPESALQLAVEKVENDKQRTTFGLGYRVDTQGTGDLYLARFQYSQANGAGVVDPPVSISTAPDHDVGKRHRLAYHDVMGRYLVLWEDTRQGETGLYFRTVPAN